MNINKILNNLNEPKINKLFYKKKKIKSVNQMIIQYKKKGNSYLNSLKMDDLYKILNYTNKSYIENNIKFDDVLYNNLKNYIIDKSDNYDSALSNSFINNYKT